MSVRPDLVARYTSLVTARQATRPDRTAIARDCVRLLVELRVLVYEQPGPPEERAPLQTLQRAVNRLLFEL